MLKDSFFHFVNGSLFVGLSRLYFHIMPGEVKLSWPMRYSNILFRVLEVSWSKHKCSDTPYYVYCIDFVYKVCNRGENKPTGEWYWPVRSLHLDFYTYPYKLCWVRGINWLCLGRVKINWH